MGTAPKPAPKTPAAVESTKTNVAQDTVDDFTQDMSLDESMLAGNAGADAVAASGQESLSKKRIGFAAVLSASWNKVNEACEKLGLDIKGGKGAAAFEAIVGKLDGDKFVGAEGEEGKFVRMDVTTAQIAMTLGEKRNNGISPAGNALAAVVLAQGNKPYDKAKEHATQNLDEAAKRLKTDKEGKAIPAAELKDYAVRELEAIKVFKAALAKTDEDGTMAILILTRGIKAANSMNTELLGGKEAKPKAAGYNNALWTLNLAKKDDAADKVGAYLKNVFFVPQRENPNKEQEIYDKNRLNLASKALVAANLFTQPTDKDANKAFVKEHWDNIKKFKENKRKEAAAE
jgi:hypothetical protein